MRRSSTEVSVKDFFGRKPFGVIHGAGLIYDRTHSYAIVFTAITVSLLLSTALTALLIKPWAKIGEGHLTR